MPKIVSKTRLIKSIWCFCFVYNCLTIRSTNNASTTTGRTTESDSGRSSLLKDFIKSVDDLSPVAAISGCSKIETDDVRFYSFTKNSYSMQIIDLDATDSLTNSTLDVKKQTKILIHGWKNDGLDFWKDTVEAYFNGSLSVVNVIIADWHRYSPRCVDPNRIIKEVGSIMIDMLNFLLDSSVKPSRIHIIGYSLGSQIAGYAAHRLPGKSKIARITGLDPVGFSFYQRSVDPILSDEDAHFVDCIHTSLGTLTSVKVGHADFYPNGGMYQPNCSLLDVSCSHAMSPVYYTYSITHPKAYCATRCDSYLQYERNSCRDEETEYMGEYVSTEASGNYFLNTKGVNPIKSCKRN